MYEKLHRWVDEDNPVAVADNTDEPATDDDVQPAGQQPSVIDYKRRIMPEDEY